MIRVEESGQEASFEMKFWEGRQGLMETNLMKGTISPKTFPRVKLPHTCCGEASILFGCAVDASACHLRWQPAIRAYTKPFSRDFLDWPVMTVLRITRSTIAAPQRER